MVANDQLPWVFDIYMGLYDYSFANFSAKTSKYPAFEG